MVLVFQREAALLAKAQFLQKILMKVLEHYFVRRRLESLDAAHTRSAVDCWIFAVAALAKHDVLFRRERTSKSSKCSKSAQCPFEIVVVPLLQMAASSAATAPTVAQRVLVTMTNLLRPRCPRNDHQSDAENAGNGQRDGIGLNTSPRPSRSIVDAAAVQEAHSVEMEMAENLLCFEWKYRFWSLAMAPLMALTASTVGLKPLSEAVTAWSTVFLEAVLLSAASFPRHPQLTEHLESMTVCTVTLCHGLCSRSDPEDTVSALSALRAASDLVAVFVRKMGRFRDRWPKSLSLETLPSEQAEEAMAEWTECSGNALCFVMRIYTAKCRSFGLFPHSTALHDDFVASRRCDFDDGDAAVQDTVQYLAVYSEWIKGTVQRLQSVMDLEAESVPNSVRSLTLTLSRCVHIVFIRILDAVTMDTVIAAADGADDVMVQIRGHADRSGLALLRSLAVFHCTLSALNGPDDAVGDRIDSVFSKQDRISMTKQWAAVSTASSVWAILDGDDGVLRRQRGRREVADALKVIASTQWAAVSSFESLHETAASMLLRCGHSVLQHLAGSDDDDGDGDAQCQWTSSLFVSVLHCFRLHDADPRRCTPAPPWMQSAERFVTSFRELLCTLTATDGVNGWWRSLALALCQYLEHPFSAPIVRRKSQSQRSSSSEPGWGSLSDAIGRCIESMIDISSRFGGDRSDRGRGHSEWVQALHRIMALLEEERGIAIWGSLNAVIFAEKEKVIKFVEQTVGHKVGGNAQRSTLKQSHPLFLKLLRSESAAVGRPTDGRWSEREVAADRNHRNPRNHGLCPFQRARCRLNVRTETLSTKRHRNRIQIR